MVWQVLVPGTQIVTLVQGTLSELPQRPVPPTVTDMTFVADGLGLGLGLVLALADGLGEGLFGTRFPLTGLTGAVAKLGFVLPPPCRLQPPTARLANKPVSKYVNLEFPENDKGAPTD